jgi:ABC-type uncharacterized transport system permease subunit
MAYFVETNNFGHVNFFDIFQNSVSAAIMLTLQVSGNAFNIGFSVSASVVADSDSYCRDI